MNNKKVNNYFVKLLFCLTIIFFVSCEKEDSTILNSEKSKVRIVSLKDVLEISESINSKKSLSARNMEGSIFDNIIPDGIIEIEKEDGTRTYTLGLSLEEPPNQMTNLVINEIVGGFQYYTVRYQSENMETFKDEIHLGQQPSVSFTTLTEHIDYEDLSGRGSGDCYEDVYSYVCPSGEHTLMNRADCVYAFDRWSIRMTNTKQVPCDGGNEGSTGSYTPPGGTPNNGGSSGSGSGTGGTGDTGMTSPNPSPIVTQPVVVTTADNCSSLKKLTEKDTLGPNIKPEVDWLKTKLDEKKEYGVEIAKGISFEGNTKYTATRKFSESSFEVSLFQGRKYMCWMHTHPSKISYPMFSFLDIKFLSEGYTLAGDDKKQEVVTIMVCKNSAGQIQTYALKVTNPELLVSQVNAVWNNAKYSNLNDKEKIDKINESLAMEYEKNSDQLERKFLELFGNCGISLYKANADLSIWTNLSLQTTNGVTTVKQTTCK